MSLIPHLNNNFFILTPLLRQNNHMKNCILIICIIPYLLLCQSNQVLDTIHFDEVEWVDNYTAHKKGSDEPFTGVVTFSGELDYSKGISWHIRDNHYYSTATFVSGKFMGPYTLWYEKGGQKKSETSLLNEQRAEIQLDGPYTEWYKNGQVKTKGSYYYGDIHGLNVSWYENGQMATKITLDRGDPVGIHEAWHENGEKAYKSTYMDNDLISTTEWDENGNKVREWPKADNDNYGLQTFLNECVRVLKSRDHNGIEDLFISKEKYMVYLEKMAKIYGDDDYKNSSNYKEINEGWKEIINYQIMRLGFKEFIEDDALYDQYIKNASVQGMVYDYHLMFDDKQSLKIKWPESINYDVSSAAVVNAKVTLLMMTDNQQYTRTFLLMYEDKTWHFFPYGE